MTATRAPAGTATTWTTVLASLVPLTGFLVATAVAEDSVSYVELVGAAPFYIGFVSVPSLLALAAARTRWIRCAVLAVLTAVAATAGVIVATSHDGQAGLAVLWVPYVAVPLAGVLWIGRVVLTRPPPSTIAEPATPSVRLAALVIDVAILGATLLVPVTRLSHAGFEIVGGVVAGVFSTIYLSVLVSWWGRTIGQSLVGIAVVDVETQRPVPFGRALARSIVVVLEVAAIATIFLAPAALAEWLATLQTGRSITDKLLGTAVVTHRRADIDGVVLSSCR